MQVLIFTGLWILADRGAFRRPRVALVAGLRPGHVAGRAHRRARGTDRARAAVRADVARSRGSRSTIGCAQRRRVRRRSGPGRRPRLHRRLAAELRVPPRSAFRREAARRGDGGLDRGGDDPRCGRATDRAPDPRVPDCGPLDRGRTGRGCRVRSLVRTAPAPTRARRAESAGGRSAGGGRGRGRADPHLRRTRHDLDELVSRAGHRRRRHFRGGAARVGARRWQDVVHARGHRPARTVERDLHLAAEYLERPDLGDASLLVLGAPAAHTLGLRAGRCARELLVEARFRELCRSRPGS